MKDILELDAKLNKAIDEFALHTREEFPEGSTNPVSEADMAQLSRLMVYALNDFRKCIIDYLKD